MTTSEVRETFDDAAELKPGQSIQVLTPGTLYTNEVGTVFGVNAELGRVVLYFPQFDVDHKDHPDDPDFSETAKTARAYIASKGIVDTREVWEVDGETYKSHHGTFPNPYIWVYPKADTLVPVMPGA